MFLNLPVFILQLFAALDGTYQIKRSTIRHTKKGVSRSLLQKKLLGWAFTNWKALHQDNEKF